MNNTVSESPLKLNYRRTFLIGFAFFGILLLWQVYDSWCPTFLTDIFARMNSINKNKLPQLFLWQLILFRIVLILIYQYRLLISVCTNP